MSDIPFIRLSQKHLTPLKQKPFQTLKYYLFPNLSITFVCSIITILQLTIYLAMLIYNYYYYFKQSNNQFYSQRFLGISNQTLKTFKVLQPQKIQKSYVFQLLISPFLVRCLFDLKLCSIRNLLFGIRLQKQIGAIKTSSSIFISVVGAELAVSVINKQSQCIITSSFIQSAILGALLAELINSWRTLIYRRLLLISILGIICYFIISSIKQGLVWGYLISVILGASSIFLIREYSQNEYGCIKRIISIILILAVYLFFILNLILD